MISKTKLVSTVLLTSLIASFSYAEDTSIKKEEVVGAIYQSLANHDLQCDNGGFAWAEDWSYLKLHEMKVDEKSQPVLVFSSKTRNIEQITSITTNSNQTEVTKIEFVENNLTYKTVNSGTILRPRYTESMTRTKARSLTCDTLQ